MEENSKETARVIGKPFEKGETGNPNGRPLGQRNYATIYREALIKLATMNDMKPEDMETDILLKGLASARKGDYRFWKDLMDRLHGQPIKKTEMVDGEGKTVKPILVKFVSDDGNSN